MRNAKPLTDPQIEALVSQICEPDKTDECDALQVLLQEIDHAIVDNCDDPNEAITRALWVLQIARARAFAMFPDEMDQRADKIRTRLFGRLPRTHRRKPLRTRSR